MEYKKMIQLTKYELMELEELLLKEMEITEEKEDFNLLSSYEYLLKKLDKLLKEEILKKIIANTNKKL